MKKLTRRTLFFAPGAVAAELSRHTPDVEEGPYYPTQLPLDTDNDLLVVNNALTPETGEVAHHSGRIMDAAGGRVRNAVGAIWQVDRNGTYLKMANGGRPGNFQDRLYRRIGANADLVTVDFVPIRNVELAAKFDIILGWTPEA